MSIDLGKARRRRFHRVGVRQFLRVFAQTLFQAAAALLSIKKVHLSHAVVNPAGDFPRCKQGPFEFGQQPSLPGRHRFFCGVESRCGATHSRCCVATRAHQTHACPVQRVVVFVRAIDALGELYAALAAEFLRPRLRSIPGGACAPLAPRRICGAPLRIPARGS